MTISTGTQFGASPDSLTSSDSTSGVLKMNLPDVGIEQLTVTREAERERDFSVLLRNNAYSGLVAGRHTVRLEVYDTSDFENSTPIAAETISDAEGLDTLNNGTLPLSITLSGTAIEGLLDEKGEIPENGAWVFFKILLLEDGVVTEDADIGNDTDYVMVHSLLEKNGAPVSIASLTEWAEGQTTVRAEALNNSMNGIGNGNIIVSLKDENGNVLAIQQTFDPSDAPGSLVSVAGEETGEASFLFDQAGTSADVLFSRIDEGGTKLSVLRMRGVPLDFDRDVYQYDLETTGLTETLITAVAENPASVVTATRNGKPVLTSEPCPLSYGMNTFVITVTTGTDVVIYTVNVQNAGGGDDSGTTSSGDTASTPASSHSVKLIVNGIERKITIRVEGNKAVISLGGLAEEIFTGSGSTDLAIPSIPGVNAYTLEMPAGSLSSPYGKAALTVNTALGSITIPSGMLAGVTGPEGKTAGITITAGDKSNLPGDVKTAIGDRPLISLTLSIDGKQVDWNNPNAPVTLSIPYTPTAAELANPESIVVWYIDGSGKAVCVPNGRYDPVTGMVTFTTTHFSDFAVTYKKVGFKDVAADAWYNRAVSFIAARGITTGTGNGNNSPAAKLTRVEFIVLMMRAYGIALDENPDDNFADAGNTWYTGYLAAAKRLGISAGVGNNMYMPGKETTRQEMFTLLYNALKVTGQLPQGDEWAKDPMTLLAKTGIIQGSGGKLDLLSTATRAEMAQVLYNLLGK
ncbi:MAG: S-layer homology domain-containing protein [Clostridiaceae bacterium]|nr:S-layer homology domain-containing protein [Clostridiaceae bacterium]